MSSFIITAMVFLGSALMVYNIYGFVHFVQTIKKRKNWDNRVGFLYIPIVLLVFFLLGYLIVGIFGKPDLVVSSILFGGSIFVCVIYHVLNHLTNELFEDEDLSARLMAAEESNRLKNSFLASISHEMRTPMNVIIGLDEIALRNPALPGETKEQLIKIRLSTKHLLGLIDNILDVNRLDTGKMVIRSERFSMPDTLSELNTILTALCAEKGLAYEPADWMFNDAWFMGDELLIRRVLHAVLDNAVKYTDAPGSVIFTVDERSTDEENREVRFTVKDTGIGISREFLPKLFDVFSKEDASTTSRFGGGGVSLSVAKRIVTLMGGTIEVESEKGKGSTFTITLPLLSLKVKQAETPAVEPVSLSGLRILIVEDVEENAEIVSDLLELEDAESERAENGQIAVEMVKNSPPFYYAAILMDLRMPVMDGLTAAREIRKLNRMDVKIMPIIALTANAFDSDVQQTMDAGMNAHLAKPVDADVLYRTLRQWIQEHQHKLKAAQDE